ncbi:Phage-related baseplate assembly protein [Aliarcobacter thereius]|uniref:Phage-related baseplate assembly protein n=1 Tax=Aliarcobacter thereius TaxID=544718 RepID=A0A1C0B237_9BACT|nr:Phage-related baseplate assembly protein [Aliarcobacter thereius]
MSNTIEAFSNDLIIDDSKLINLYDDKVNKSQEIIVLEVRSKAYFPNALDEYVDIESSTQKFEMQYSVELKAIPRDIIYRPQITIKKPKIYGVQTALVTSQDINNESLKEKANSIDVDEEGRVRVLFFFERNKIASCYLRVSNMSSGDNYGTMFIPRVNSEVIVSFVNGDPDSPIIIGTLNNGENKIAYSLPNNKTKSYIRTYTTPQYSDSIGYNELMFEDYQGKEEINIRAQRDLNTEVLNNENKRVDKDQRVIIRGDKEESINKNSKLNVKENYEINVQNDFIENVSNNKVINVSENLDVSVNKNINVNIVENLKYIIEKDFIESIKGSKIEYVEKDVKLRYLNNLFTQVDKDFRLDVKGSYHIKSNSIKQEANIIELIANNGITIRSGANSITVDGSGIHLNSASINTQSSLEGVNAVDIEMPIIDKPKYEKLRVKELESNIVKQNSIEEQLIFKASVEKYKDENWEATNSLSEFELNQIIWVVLTNNDKEDKDIVQDEISDNVIAINEFELKLDISKSNRCKYAHIFCYVDDYLLEGYSLVELKRDIKVDDIKLNYISNEEVELEAILNVDEATQEELEQIVWNINSKDILAYNGKTKIQHNIKEEKVYKTIFNAYIKDNQTIESSANTSAVFDEEKIISNSNKNDNIVFYEAINREYKFTQKAYLLAEGVGIGGTFTIRGHINLNNDGELFVSASGFSAAKFSGNINYKMSIEVKINEQTIQKDTFSQKGEELWSNDNDFSPIGSIKLKLPNPKIDDIISLYLIATYTYSTGHGSAVPTTTINPFSKEASLGIKEIKLRIINNKIQKDKN